MALDTDSHHYIPAGSFSLHAVDRDVIYAAWGPDETPSWKWLNNVDVERTAPGPDTHQPYHVFIKSQNDLFKLSGFGDLRTLLEHQWIKVQVLLTAGGGTLRVYLLPDDKLRGTIDRSVPHVQKSRVSLIRSLDYSTEAWNGIRTPDNDSAKPFDHNEAEWDNQSLLQLFNSIPSPTPEPYSVNNAEAQICMRSLLESKVEGLKTELYPYQRRSAAMMLQKEAQPGTVLDPRLLLLKDQNGGCWYLDPIACIILREPRYYDGIPGGILAEEMGSGKTIICLSLILSTRLMQMKGPDIYGVPEPRRRPKLASLMDMAASSANRNGVPWRYLMKEYSSQTGLNHDNCIKVLDDTENYGYYLVPTLNPRRCGRRAHVPPPPPKRVYLSTATIVVVPNNLLQQWRDEITKHTSGLRSMIIGRENELPDALEFMKCDIVLFSQTRFEMEVRLGMASSPLSCVHFRRCIVDEGHKLGNSRMSNRSLLLTGLDALHVSSRWIVTGTPSRGLFGVDYKLDDLPPDSPTKQSGLEKADKILHESPTELERKDLERLGAIATLYLKARPWANTSLDTVDTVADWNTYLMLPKHGGRSQGRQECLKLTLNSLIVRHRINDVSHLLPLVHEKLVVLDGSYHDQLSLNIFSMMIIFNAVQSQRTDQDYFFHSKQKSALLQIVLNLKMSTFFGASFYARKDIAKAVETAEEFLREKKVPISNEDQVLLEDALSVGRLAMGSNLRHLSNMYHEMPVCVSGFPGLGDSMAWGFTASGQGDSIITIASLLLPLQKTLYDAASKPEELNALLNGGLERRGLQEKEQIEKTALEESSGKKEQTLAGNTKLGDDSRRKSQRHGVNNIAPVTTNLSKSLEPTKVTATISAKLSYLLDSIVKYQDEEKIIVFYEHENTAWYIANMLDVVSFTMAMSLLRKHRICDADGSSSFKYSISSMPGGLLLSEKRSMSIPFTRTRHLGRLICLCLEFDLGLYTTQLTLTPGYFSWISPKQHLVLTCGRLQGSTL